MMRVYRLHCVALICLLLLGALLPLWSQDKGVMFLAAPIYPPDGNVDQRFPDQFVFYHHETLDLILAYRPAPDSPRIVHRIKAPPDLAPEIVSTVSRSSQGGYQYRYVVTNGRANALPIHTWQLSVPEPRPQDYATITSQVSKHESQKQPWRQSLYASRPGQWSIRFDHQSEMPLLSNQSATFAVENKNKPGFVKAHFEGVISLPDSILEDLPTEAREQLLSITETWGKAHVWTIGPKFQETVTSREIAMDFSGSIFILSLHGFLDTSSPFIQAVQSRLNEFIGRLRPWDGVEDFPREVFDSLAYDEPFAPIGQQPDSESHYEKQLDAALKAALVNP